MRLVIIALTLCFFLPTAYAADNSNLRLITVSGQGKVRAAPDRADISMTIESRQKELGVAREDVTQRVNAFLQEMDKLNIERKRLSNSGLVVRPEYRWIKASQTQELSGYFVSRQISVDLRDLEKLGAVLERAVNAGVNQVSPPRMGSTKEAVLRREALRRASVDAKLNADAAATSLNSVVGAVRDISTEYQMAPQPTPMRGRMMAMSAEADSSGAEQSYETGEISFSAQVRVSFDLLPR